MIYFQILIYKNTIDVLYEICNTGRICYFNQITSHNTNNSSIFEKSIQALSDLSVKLERLNNTEKKGDRTQEDIIFYCKEKNSDKNLLSSSSFCHLQPARSHFSSLSLSLSLAAARDSRSTPPPPPGEEADPTS